MPTLPASGDEHTQQPLYINIKMLVIYNIIILVMSGVNIMAGDYCHDVNAGHR